MIASSVFKNLARDRGHRCGLCKLGVGASAARPKDRWLGRCHAGPRTSVAAAGFARFWRAALARAPDDRLWRIAAPCASDTLARSREQQRRRWTRCWSRRTLTTRHLAAMKNQWRARVRVFRPPSPLRRRHLSSHRLTFLTSFHLLCLD